MTNAAEELQRVFKTLSDPTRVRILHLLESEELMVQELMDVLGMAQSRVSRHLAILRENGLVRDRRDGTYVFYRAQAPAEGAWSDAWTVARRALANDATAQRDLAALQRALDARGERSRRFFDAVGPEWDALRKVFDDDVLRARALARLAPPRMRVLDLGTGTGVLAADLAGLGLHVIAVDRSQRMLDAARANLEHVGARNVELRRGDANHLPLADGEVDAAFAHMALQYLPQPTDAIREMTRCLAPGGVIVLVDFVAHDQAWMREDLGVMWSGFEPEEVLGWLADAGLEDRRSERLEGRTRSRDLPATFIASARKPR